MTEIKEKPAAAKPATSPWLKMTLELGPLILFFFANARPKLFAPYAHLVLPAHLLVGENAGLFTATAVLIPAVLIALAVSYAQIRRLPVMPLVTAILVVIFGALTIYFQDPRFIKMKPTILYAVFGLALLGGLYLKKPILEVVLDNAMPLTEEGWRILTLRWGLFFLALAILNEVIWRTQSNNVWVAFKFPGVVILIFLFTLAQVPLMMRHELKEDKAE
ncbi:septation protein A [uncultured Methylovirgula sp.]|uniref:septation protein A n=1 Tax=uncultured Methylovirgula sp. TaxID=1285960 RepID=UPI00260F7746|nr:septation protein A [uncultured Methylovirgula sp.]